MDLGNYGEEFCRGSVAVSSHIHRVPKPQQFHARKSQHSDGLEQQAQPQQERNTDTPPKANDTAAAISATVDLYPGQTPFAPAHGTAKLDAFAANVQIAPSLSNPDDCYRDNRGVHAANAVLLAPAVNDSMAFAASSNRQTPSLRPNGHGTSSKYPVLAISRSALRPTYRSVSNLVDDRRGSAASAGDAGSAGNAINVQSARSTQTPPIKKDGDGHAIGTLSVMDLKKRFDQTASSSNMPSRTMSAQHGSTKSRTPIQPNGRASGVGTSAAPHATLRSNSTRDYDFASSPSTRATVRPKCVAEDQLFSNPRSFVSRISRPRNAAATSNTQTTRPLPKLASTSSPQGFFASAPNSVWSNRSNGLLFGEILTGENNRQTAGFGINGARPRSTSDSNFKSPTRPRLRSLSDADAEPSSPAEWYHTAPAQQAFDFHPAAPRVVATRDNETNILPKLARPRIATANLHAAASAGSSPSSPTSRIPVSFKKFSHSCSSTSPASSRPNSPVASRRMPGSGRGSRQNAALAGGPKTPSTNHSTVPGTRAKTPTGGRPMPSGNRLNAYVATPPAPTWSPTRRSSRPRQSVATATTAASRMKSVDRLVSPNPSDHKIHPWLRFRPPSQAGETAARRPRISIGPVDFAQRRETIKLAYSKSIRETQAREARQTIEEKKKERKAADQAKVPAEAEAASAALVFAAAVEPSMSDAEARPAVAPELALVASTESPHGQKDSQEDEANSDDHDSLLMAANVSSREREPVGPEITNALRSPPMQMPGGFPGSITPQLVEEEIPMSPVSAMSAITEFDAESQTEALVQELRAAAVDEFEAPAPTAAPETHISPAFADATIPTPAAQPSSLLYKRASYHSPFDTEGMTDDTASTNLSPEESAPSSPQQTSGCSDIETDLALPGTFHDEYEPQPYAVASSSCKTTVTILGPEPDFRPMQLELPPETSRGSEQQDQQEAEAVRAQHLSIDSLLHEHGSVADASVQMQVDELEKLDKLEEFYTGRSLRDHIALLRDATLTSEREKPFDAQSPAADFPKSPSTVHSLTVPFLLHQDNRFSQASSWTDFSLESVEVPNMGARSLLANVHETQYDERGSVTLLEGTISADVGATGLATVEIPYEATLGKHQLPELDIGATFSEACLSGEAPVQTPKEFPDLPSYDPPLPPQQPLSIASTDGFDYESSAFEVETRPSSYRRSQDDDAESGDLTRSTSLAYSRRHSSLDPTEPSGATPADLACASSGPHTLPDQELKRLKQRQLVIRELIDTEAIFIRDLSVVEEIYKGTAEACPNLDSKTIKLVFRNTDEIISFHSTFLQQLRDGVACVYTLKTKKSPLYPDQKDSDSSTSNSSFSRGAPAIGPEPDDDKDRRTRIGSMFAKNIDKLKAVHELYLRSSDISTKRLLQIQEDPTVKVWLSECNEVAKDLTSAWNLDSLLIKPMQRITKYPDIITHLLKYTPEDHPDRESLVQARTTVIDAIDEINKTKKNFELVGQIVSSRKRKDSDVRAGLAKAFGRRVDKLQASNRPTEDEEYLKLNDKFGDDYLRLQVVLRDVEYYARMVSSHVSEFLRYLSSMELVMRLQPTKYHAHLESKWVQFNVSMRDIEKMALEKHLDDVRTQVIEPFEQVIRCYANPSTAMRKRSKRRLDYERYMQLKANGKKIDKQLVELVEQYEALNDTLKKELPKLSALTAQVGNICLGKFVSIQTIWYGIWRDKIKAPLPDASRVPEFVDIVSTFHRDFKDMEDEAMNLGILNPALKSRPSQSNTDDSASTFSKIKSRAGDSFTSRGRGLSFNSDSAPSLPASDFVKRNSGQFTFSPPSTLPSPGHCYRDHYSGINGTLPDTAGAFRSIAQPVSTRPNTGRSHESSLPTRQNSYSNKHSLGQGRRDSNPYRNEQHVGLESRRFSDLFQSALPPPDGLEEKEKSRLSSRASSRERSHTNGGYNVLWLAASLFEFNIEKTKIEAGYPYLTYGAGEIFDVIAEKGELWLAKNQDDPNDMVGWIWSKHFAKLADS